eukprot:CAMPEP_0177684852 /NCGR_PEP_ID=MMETSP0447-20121125/32653_1 /TAXON_ID=0 /ORGANISM="Stygamoeba regulata, Strain BSH-02190019" /LENGTH=92 /DNA_ID=CAMNT_0019194729 /DNA_START=167 /DNA_END=445 /DNA_ORIENTATION=+
MKWLTILQHRVQVSALLGQIVGPYRLLELPEDVKVASATHLLLAGAPRKTSAEAPTRLIGALQSSTAAAAAAAAAAATTAARAISRVGVPGL